jgi:hypothetical protein
MPRTPPALLGLCVLAQAPGLATPPALRQTLIGLCTEAARALEVPVLENHAPRDPGRLPFLLAQARALAPSAEGLPPGDPLRPLASATLGALEVALGQEEAGFQRYGKAAKALAAQWRADRTTKGPASLELLPDLDHLATLYALAGLRKDAWRDEALRIRCAANRAADSGLEEDLAAAVEDHYGPWLTPVELAPTLEFCTLLARRWQREPDDRVFTRRLAKVGMKDSADHVWGLAARKGPEGLRNELQALLARLDAATLLEDPAWAPAALKVVEALRDTPLQGESDRLMNRLDALLARQGTSRSGLRRRIAQIREDASAEQALLAEELALERDPAALRGLLGEAAVLLERPPGDGLLRAGTPRILALARTVGPGDDAAQNLYGTWLQLLRRAGDLPSAEALAPFIHEAESPAAPSSEEAPPPGRVEPTAEDPRAADLREAVAPILELARHSSDPQAALLRLEAILPQVEASPDAELQAECLGTLAWLQSQEGRDQDLEATFQLLFRLLEARPDLKGDAKEAPLLYLVHLWRAQRLDDVIARMRRWEALLRRNSDQEWVEKLAKYGPSFERMARFQGLLRAAGLP